MNFEKFINSPARVAWIKGPKTLSVYVRRTPNNPYWRDHYGDFQIANMFTETMGQGALTEFLNELESRYSIFVENVLNERLIPFLERRGYKRVGNDTVLPSFLRKKQ